MIHYCQSHLPIEACGMLSGEGNHIRSIYPLENIEHSDHNFAIGEKDFNNTLREIKTKREVFNGVFHSHPTSPAVPSKGDVKNAYSPDIIYFIISLARKDPQVEAYKFRNGNISKLNINVRGT